MATFDTAIYGSPCETTPDDGPSTHPSSHLAISHAHGTVSNERQRTVGMLKPATKGWGWRVVVFSNEEHVSCCSGGFGVVFRKVLVPVILRVDVFVCWYVAMLAYSCGRLSVHKTMNSFTTPHLHPPYPQPRTEQV
jgi:hypothetical protein